LDVVWRDHGVALTLVREAIDAVGPDLAACALLPDKYNVVLCDLNMDLVSMLGPHTSCPHVAQLLQHMIEICSVKEMNLSLLELLDGRTKLHDQLELLPLLAQVVCKVWSSNVWKTTHSTAQTVLRQIKDTFLATENLQSVKKTKLTHEVSEYIDTVASFLESVATVVSNVQGGLDDERKQEWSKLCDFCIDGLISLMGSPLSVSSTYKIDDCERTLTEDGERASRIMELLSLVKCKYHSLLEEEVFCYQQQQRQQSATQPPADENRSMGVACVAYWWVGEGKQWSTRPTPLRLEYIVQMCFRSVIVLLEEYDKSDVYVEKGQLLLQKSVAMVTPECYNMADLMVSCCTELLTKLTTVAIFCQTEHLRKKSVPLFRKVVQLFTPQARHRIYRQLFHKSNNPGVWGLLIHDIKNEVHLAIKNDLQDSPFLGKSLNILLYVALSLPVIKDKTSILENSDRLMGAVNLLIYLVLADKSIHKRTMVWDDLEHWKQAFCKPLMNAIDDSKDQHQRFLEGLINEEKDPQLRRDKRQPEMAVEVGGELLQGISDPDSKEGVIESLLQLDVMEDSVKRVQELLEAPLPPSENHQN
jgi:hypothetical protein